MSATKRAASINKLFKIAKKHYPPVQPPSNRSVLEHLMYACCLEDSSFEAADESLAKLQENFFDWNEVRVTTAIELSENLSSMYNATASASRLKKTLHSVFETYYSFDIDAIKKENLGKAVQALQKHKNISSFVVSYVSQNALGGHSIPIDQAMVLLFRCLDLMTEKDAANFKVTGLERTIPKTKGVEFFSVVHQLAVAFLKSPFNNDIRKLILSIDPTAKERMPKRATKKKPAAKPAKKAAPKKPVEKPIKKKTAKAKPASARKTKTDKKKVAKKKTTAKKTVVKKTVVKKKTAAKKADKKKPTRKSPTKRLAKKKPR